VIVKQAKENIANLHYFLSNQPAFTSFNDVKLLMEYVLLVICQALIMNESGRQTSKPRNG
jgi:hypothetical protein